MTRPGQPFRAAAPGYLLTHQVAEIFFVSPKTVTRWAKEDHLPFLRTLGGHRRFPEAEIRALAATLVVPADTHDHHVHARYAGNISTHPTDI